MTQEEFNNINWHRGNVVMLENGKEYFLKGTKGHGKYLLLYSEEYDSSFVADYRIVNCRTSDYEEPEEVYLEKKRKHQAEAEARREEERQAARLAKAERKRMNLEAQERAHQEALARKAAKIKERELARQKALELEQSRQEAKAAKKAAQEKPQPKPQPKVQPKPQPKPAPVVEAKKAETPKAAEPAPEAPRKRVRQRIRISSASPFKK